MRSGDSFGAALSAWDFGKGPQSDLAIGIPGREVGPASGGPLIDNAGAVLVLYGLPTGLGASASQFWHREIAGVKGTAGTGDRFGAALY